MATYIKASLVRRLVRDHHRRVSVEFLEALDRYVAETVEKSIAVHNGGRRTLDATVLAYVTGKIK